MPIPEADRVYTVAGRVLPVLPAEQTPDQLGLADGASIKVRSRHCQHTADTAADAGSRVGSIALTVASTYLDQTLVLGVEPQDTIRVSEDSCGGALYDTDVSSIFAGIGESYCAGPSEPYLHRRQAFLVVPAPAPVSIFCVPPSYFVRTAPQ